MAAARRSSKAQSSKQLIKKVLDFFRPSNLWEFATNPEKCSCYLAGFLVFVEIFINVAVIWRIRYTEIDWIAYMQEVEGVVNGTTDYSLLKGDTGPLVYPAGFVWVYTALYYVTGFGKNVRLAQYLFAGVYLVILTLVFRILLKSGRVPNLALILISCTSYRIHSICVLRLFNDPVAMMFLYAAVNCFMDDRWSLGSFLYSFAVSIKMNVLLFSPALFLAYLATQGIFGTVKQLTICASLQVILALPFLATHPVNYLKGSFDLGRVFLFKWTVNWRFLPEEIFVHCGLHLSLLLIHVLLLAMMARTWLTSLSEYKKDKRVVSKLLLPLFTANFIGIACARSLHYQFYVWYYHQLHFLCWSGNFGTRKPDILRLLILGVVEMCWNTYPSTDVSSAMLHLCHFVILLSLFCRKPKDIASKSE